MINKDIRESLPEEAIVFDNPSYDNSILGVTDDNRIVYNYDSMIEELMSDENMNYEDAADFVSYNTVRALGYFSKENKPIVVYPI
ncbi:MAG: hypothetical protein MJZ37_06355 [Bacilli bacterium]|nr:hypothetical protein [Bacilli bacterium]